MNRRRFFVPKDRIAGGIARLSAEEVHHLRDVLRLRAGQVVEVFDGAGRSYVGRVQRDDGGLSVGSLERIEARAESPIDVSLGLALIKYERFEWALEKATELGVREIVPLASRRCQVRLPQGKLEARLERWRRIVREAAKQCGRSAVPEVAAPRSFAEYLAAGLAGTALLLLCETSAAPWDGRIEARRIGVTIGPEGGWTAEELRSAEQAGCRIVGFGPRVLRAETAAIAALAIVQFERGDLGAANARREGS